MFALSRNWFKLRVWSLTLFLVSTRDSLRAETDGSSKFISGEDQPTAQFFYHHSGYPRDCAEFVGRCPSSNSSGVFAVKPDGYPVVFDVYCDSDGHTVIGRRLNGIISFDRSWDDYTSGFGFFSHEFWLGNQRLSYLTNQRKYQLRIDVELNDGSTISATYDDFRISDAHSNYNLISAGQFNITGGFKYWTPWTPCPVTCGGGVKRRHLRLTDGAACVGEGCEETAVCNEEGCPVHGRWSSWTEWRSCSATCGGGRQVRERECNNPAPLHGGHPCTGETTESQNCGTDPCIVHGRWSSWSSWRQCSVTCGGGQQVRERECNNPAPRHGGRSCTGDSRQSRRCGTGSCPATFCRIDDLPLVRYMGKQFGRIEADDEFVVGNQVPNNGVLRVKCEDGFTPIVGSFIGCREGRWYMDRFYCGAE